MEDMHRQHEDPTGEASRRAATFLALALAVTQKLIERAARRAEEQANQASNTPDASVTPVTRKESDKPADEQRPDTDGAVRDKRSGRRRPTVDQGDKAAQQVAGSPADDKAPAEQHPAVDHGNAAEALAEQQRYTPLIQRVLEAELAEAVLRDQAWPALAAALGTAEQAGLNPDVVLAQVVGERELGSAKHPAQVLNLRLARRTATAADVVTSSFPTSIGDSIDTSTSASGQVRSARLASVRTVHINAESPTSIRLT